MSRLSVLFCAAAVALFATAAFGDDDPTLASNGVSCAGSYWCAGSGLAVDPNTGISTLEYTLKPSAGGATAGIDPSTFQTGWAAAVTGTTVDDLLHFVAETVGSTTTDYVFLYCGDAQCSADDLTVPLPNVTIGATFTDDAYSIGGSSYSSTYAPTSGLPGYAVGYSAPHVYVTPNHIAEYTIADNPPFVSAMEPSSVLQLASMMIALGAFFVYRKFSVWGA